MTIVFSNSRQKLHTLGIFGPKFKDFNVCGRPSFSKYLMGLISKMTMAFSNSKNTQIKQFLSYMEVFFTFALNFAY